MADLQIPPVLASDERFSMLLELLQDEFARLDLQAMAVYLVDQVRPSLLPVLADQFSLLDEAAWQLAESEEARRDLVKNAIHLHRAKGTPWSIREVIRLLGFGNVRIQEGLAGIRHNGQANRDGRYVHGDAKAWPLYRVILLERAITNDQAALLRRLLLSIAPARCRLVSLEYREVPVRHNGLAKRDGQYNHGSS